MKVFLSWSGKSSHAVARALRDWLPVVVQAVEPWLSSTDIQAGSRWQSELEFQLKESRVGIICLTPDNLTASWLLFEAGALSKEFGQSYVCPYLFGFQPSDLTGPLAQFQAVQSDRDGTRALVHTLNRALGENSLKDSVLNKMFELLWVELSETLTLIGNEPPETQPRHLPSREKEPAGGAISQELEAVIESFSSGSQESPALDRLPKQRVFLVHGRNMLVREQVARFIELLGLSVIIFDETPSSGRTVIEKLENFSEIDYVIALLTGDDATERNVTSPEATILRARQNVIFELGFFSAKLGRSRVCVMTQEGIEIPSDLSGILYLRLDSHGAWKLNLAREFKVAGLSIDLNKAL